MSFKISRNRLVLTLCYSINSHRIWKLFDSSFRKCKGLSKSVRIMILNALVLDILKSHLHVLLYHFFQNGRLYFNIIYDLFHIDRHQSSSFDIFVN